MKKWAKEVLQRCDIIASYSENSHNITRRFLTPPMKDLHQLITKWMYEAGLEVKVDNAGNIIGRRIENDNFSSIIIGSHLDTVINAGKYDGILGFLLGLSLVKILKEKGISLQKNIEIIGFSDEEGIRFKKNFLGSLARINSFPKEYLVEKDEDNISIKEAIINFGLDPKKINQSKKLKEGDLFLEIHTEQGMVLAKNKFSLGIVDAIVGQTHWMLEFSGKANHAGTCVMEDRQDSLVCAAQAIFSITKKAKLEPNLVATCGVIKNEPNAINVISGNTKVSLDVRHAKDKIRNQFLEEIEKELKELAKESNVSFSKKILGEKNSIQCSPKIKSMLKKACQNKKIPPFFITSGAGHDAMIMAQKIPMGMLFICSPNGLSHHPDEVVNLKDVENSLLILEEFFNILQK